MDLVNIWGVFYAIYIFLGYFIYLHFKCYPPYRLPLPLLLWGCSHSHSPTTTSTPWPSPTLGHRAFTGLRAFLPIDARQCHPLLLKWLESWVPPLHSLVGGLVPGSSGGVWLVDIVILPMDLQTPSATSVFSIFEFFNSLAYLWP